MTRKPNRSRKASQETTIEEHVRGFIITSGVFTLALSIFTTGIVLYQTYTTPTDFANAQGTQVDPSDPGSGGFDFPSSNNSNTGGSGSSGNSGGTNTGGGNNNTTNTTTSPTPVTPETPEVNPEVISVNPNGTDTVTSEVISTTSTTQPTTSQSPTTQALSTAQNQSNPVPRTGGIAYISAGLIVIALGVYYYYYSKGDTKAILKMEEKKIPTKR